MAFRIRHNPKALPPGAAEKTRRDFLEAAGPAFGTMMALFESLPGIAFYVKDAAGRIVHMNRYNLEICGWRSLDDVVGYTSADLFPPDQAAVYAERDREVLESGIPIVERIYGFVADRSSSLNCVTVRPVCDTEGRRIGTASVYWRAQRTLGAENWYGPVREAVAWIDEHYMESVTVAGLARIAHYSEAQFRRHFRELMLLSPMEYLAAIRVKVAKTLLATTSKGMSEIAAETGFFDHSHFIRAFRKATGMTPKAYRRRHAAPETGR